MTLATKMAVVFDLGAVVLRWRPEVLLMNALPQRLATQEAARDFVGHFFQGFDGDWGEFDRGMLDVDTLVDRLSARVGISLGEARAVVLAARDELLPMPPTVALIERLRGAGHTLYYLSNMPAPYADHLEATHPFHDWFKDGVFSSRVKLIKPDPAIFALAEQRFGEPASRLLFIDDVARNVAAARAAGWQALQFVDAAQAEAELTRLGLLAA